MKPRITPVDPTEFTDIQLDALSSLNLDGYVLNLFRTLAVHPKLAKRWLVFANHILFKSTLSPRDREILILRIGWLCQSEYEWGQHVVMGKEAGLSDEEIIAIKQGSKPALWSDSEKLLLEAVDELRTDSKICDSTWNKLGEIYSTEQLMDIVFTVGQYNLVSMALKSFQVELDEGIPGFEYGGEEEKG